MVELDDKRREWLEKISDLNKKKEKELKALEKKKKKELEEIEEKSKRALEEAEGRMQASVKVLEEEEQTIAEQKKGKPTTPDEDLEEVIAQEPIPEIPKEQGAIYEVPIEEQVSALYQQADYNVYNELKSTLEKVQRGDYLTQQERHSFYKRQEEFKNTENQTTGIDPLFLTEKDPFGYATRSKQLMSTIRDSLQSNYQR